MLWRRVDSDDFGIVLFFDLSPPLTREIATKALPDKRAETVTRAAAEIIPDLVQEEGNYVVTTDMGNEFRARGRPARSAVHRQKDPSDRNATAVVDRAIQTLKKGPSRHGGPEGKAVGASTWTKQRRPTMPGHTRRSRWRRRTWRRCRQRPFRVYQDNATKFQHNKKLTEGRKRRLEEAGAFRAPTNARRSFEPQYGPAREIASIDSMVVRATDGTETLLNPVPRGSAEPKAKLTRPPVPLAIRQLQDFNPGPVAPP